MKTPKLISGSIRAFLKPMLAAAALCALSFNTNAALTHRYSFTDGVNDSVGTANGTIKGDATISGGAANFPGASNQDYLELPSNLISNYTTVSFEFWVNVLDNGTWEEIYAFGNQTAGGEGANMLMFCPHTGSNPADFRMSYAQASPGYNDEKVVNGTGTLDNVGPMSIACIYDPPNNAMTLYTNGTLVGTLSPVTTGTKGFSLTNVVNKFSWLGRSLYNGDAPYNGSIDEFRIYDAPLTPLQVYVNNQAGPDTVITNVEISSLSWNVDTNMVVGSRQNSTVTFNTAKYGSVTLAGATEPTYASDNPAIVRVTAQGLLYAMSVGSTTVSATYNGTTTRVPVTITAPKLIHRYSFAADAKDSVGTANGTLVGGATISGGAVVLPGGVSSSDASVAYVDLPNNLLTNITAVTFEAWATESETGSGTWARIWDFGNSAGGENVSDTGSRYVTLSTPNGGGNVQGTIHINDRGGDASVISPTGLRPVAGQQAQYVWSSDLANHTSWLYVNGALLAVNTNTTVAPSDIGTSLNDWLGRSQFGADAAFGGSITEFRIYNGAVDPTQVSIDAAAGPDQIVTDPGTIQSLRVTIGTNSVYYGGNTVLSALIADYTSLTNVNVTSATGAQFQSSDPNIFTVNSAGVLTGTGAGTATLTGSYSGKTATVPITVSNLPGYVKASLVHRYSFTDTVGSTTVKDSVGTANGNIVGKGAAFNGTGQLTLPGGTASNADAADIAAYVDLPNHIVNPLTDLSIEAWVTWQGSGSWQRIFDFGTSATGEDVSDGGGGYLFLAPQGGSYLTFSVRDPNTATEPAPLIATTPLAAGQEIYLAVVYDFTANVARLYSNSVLVVSGTAPVDIKTIDDVNVWLGRSQWGDPMFQGVFNEFRIWNGVLLPNEISAHAAAGPDSLEPPASAPKITATVSGKNLVISWPDTAGFVLQSSPNVGTGATWTAVSTAPTTANGVSTVTVPIGTGTAFYQLKK
jgi:hypothetical protein